MSSSNPERIKNTASSDDIAGIINRCDISQKKFKSTWDAKGSLGLAQDYFPFFRDLLTATKRPIGSVVKKAARIALGVTKADAQVFSDQVL